MTDIIRNGNTYAVSNQLNSFQKELYIHLIDWKWKNITKEPGIYTKKKKGYTSDAILPDEYYEKQIWPHIYPGIEQKFRAHQSHPEFGFKLHTYFYHMASSQAAAANLFLPILEHQLAEKILCSIKPDLKFVARQELDNGYKLEYWGDAQPGDAEENQGFLKDHNTKAGTDADIAIAYYNHEDKLCLWLIEHKLSENEFSECKGAKSKNRKYYPTCLCDRSFTEILANKDMCYLHQKNDYAYWTLSEVYSNFFPGHTAHHECPFNGGMNQLWRNQLLGLALESQGKFSHVYFSVVRHPQNTALLPSLEAYQKLIDHNPKFSTFTSKDVVIPAEGMNDRRLSAWAMWYKELYMIS